MAPVTPFICVDQSSSLEGAIHPDPNLKWDNGQELHVAFLEYLSDEVQKKLEFYAHQWERYANIRFIFDDRPDAQIRITFRPGGFWSWIGKQALEIPRGEATMNFDDISTVPLLSDETLSYYVLHEFGHALGLVHEHQSSAAGIQWNRRNVIQSFIDLSKRVNPNGPPPDPTEIERWVEVNIFKRYTYSSPPNPQGAKPFTPFDPRSVMLYHIDKKWTVNGFETPLNTTLSQRDKEFIQQQYPFK